MKYEPGNFIEAEYGGRNQYWVTPDNDIIEVGYDAGPEASSPSDYDEGVMGKAIFLYDAYGSNTDKKIAKALCEALPQERISEITKDFIKQHMTFSIEPYDLKHSPPEYILAVRCDEADACTPGWIISGDEKKDYIEPRLKDADYILNGMARDVTDYYYDVDDVFDFDDLSVEEYSVKYAVDNEQCPDIPFAEYVDSSVDRYSSVFVYETQEHIDRLGVPEELRQEGFDRAVKQFEAAMDGQVYYIDSTSLDNVDDSTECIGRAFGDRDVFECIPEGSVSLGLYNSLEECLEDNQERLGIELDPLPSLSDRIHAAEGISEERNSAAAGVEKTERDDAR